MFRLQAERVSVAIFLIGLCEIEKGNKKEMIDVVREEGLDSVF